MAAKSSSTYRIVCAGLNFRSPGSEHATEFAMKGAHVDLDADEAKRLEALDAVVPEGAADPPAVTPVSQNPDNPYGGFAMKSFEEHAAEAAAGAVQEDTVPAPDESATDPVE